MLQATDRKRSIDEDSMIEMKRTIVLVFEVRGLEFK